MSPRGRRAVALIAGATLVLVAVAGWSLRPTLASIWSRLRATAPAPEWRLVHVSFGDATHGAATMYRRGAITTFLTADGGSTWRRPATGPAMVQFLDGGHVLALDLDSPGQLRVSDDGGRTWRAAAQPVALGASPVRLDGAIVDAPYFLGLRDGWWLGAASATAHRSLWRTADGGRTWSDLTPTGIPPTSGPAPPEPAFADPLRGALVVPPVAFGQPPAVVATRDGGRTWRSVPVAWPQASVGPYTGSVGSAALAAAGSRLLLSVDLVVPALGLDQLVRRDLAVSDDGGLTWGEWTAAPGRLSASSQVVVAGSGRLVQADDHRLWTSADLGRTWTARALPGPVGQLAAVVSAPGSALFVVTSHGSPAAPVTSLLRSLDGGRHWAAVPLPPVPG